MFHKYSNVTDRLLYVRQLEPCTTSHISMSEANREMLGRLIKTKSLGMILD